VLVAALLLAACSTGGGSTPPASGSPGGNKLEVISWWTSGSESAALNVIFDNFKTSAPGVDIVNAAVAGGGGSNAQVVLATRLAANNPPDVWQTHPGGSIQAYHDAGLLLLQGYGLTESSPVISFNTKGHNKLGTVGRPLPGVQVRIAPDGEILTRGPHMMRGYWRREEETARTLRGGFIHTGDVARADEDGFIYIVDRAKDMIISGGMNVYSVEVENVLMEHPVVREACVIGVPDDKWGEAVKAVVVLQRGASCSEQEIIAFCRERLARFKVPRTVVFGPLPKTSTGKIQKFVLRAQAKELG
jgi:acyl-CoA synthetase (AMP-forming)/AMP-acid ligase II